MLLSSSKSFMLLAAVTMFGSMDGHMNFYIMQYRILSGYATDSTSLTWSFPMLKKSAWKLLPRISKFLDRISRVLATMVT